MDDSSEYGDNIRLAVLGEKVLECAVTDTLFKKRPMLKADEIEVRSVTLACWGYMPTLLDTCRMNVSCCCLRRA